MIRKIKSSIQNKLYNKCIQKYSDEIRLQTDPYLIWINETESKRACDSSLSAEVVCIEDCGQDFKIDNNEYEYLIFISKNGRLSNRAYFEIEDFFNNNNDIDIAYADEDIWTTDIVRSAAKSQKDSQGDKDNEIARRIFPWTKPVWSPDTLLSFLYFGNIFVIRKEKFIGIEWLKDTDYKRNIYDFVLKATQQVNTVGHIDKVLFHLYQGGNSKEEIENTIMHKTDFIGVGKYYDDIKASAMERIGVHAEFIEDKVTGVSYPLYDVSENKLVSIIIPSKDNPEVLKQCIKSVYEHSSYTNFEIIVVDNGSSEKNQQIIKEFKNEYAFNYVYEPMEFNFSKMCNIGFEKSRGEYILLLNDDMEAIEDLWLTRMVGQAGLNHTGAVGAKLLYPQTTLIQHAGISNTIYGPGHKLKQMEDNISYYYGRNRFIYDLIGVTAACLLMRREVYKALGGLYEGLAVAYNDVDLCFRIHEMGLFNVQRNDVVLYHHESLSRGDDMQDENKLKRLLAEKDKLYSRHEHLYRHDPFIGTLLNSGEPQYFCRWLEGYEIVNSLDHNDKLERGRKLPDKSKMNNAIMLSIEECGKEKFMKVPVTLSGGKEKELKDYYLVKGWSYVPGADNARYEVKLLFVNSKGMVWELPVQRRYRKDVAKIISGEKNVELSGFCCWICEGAIPADTYELWLTAKDGCSRQRLYRDTNKKIVIEG